MQSISLLLKSNHQLVAGNRKMRYNVDVKIKSRKEGII